MAPEAPNSTGQGHHSLNSLKPELLKETKADWIQQGQAGPQEGGVGDETSQHSKAFGRERRSNRHAAASAEGRSMWAFRSYSHKTSATRRAVTNTVGDELLDGPNTRSSL